MPRHMYVFSGHGLSKDYMQNLECILNLDKAGFVRVSGQFGDITFFNQADCLRYLRDEELNLFVSLAEKGRRFWGKKTKPNWDIFVKRNYLSSASEFPDFCTYTVYLKSFFQHHSLCAGRWKYS